MRGLFFGFFFSVLHGTAVVVRGTREMEILHIEHLAVPRRRCRVLPPMNSVGTHHPHGTALGQTVRQGSGVQIHRRLERRRYGHGRRHGCPSQDDGLFHHSIIIPHTIGSLSDISTSSPSCSSNGGVTTWCNARPSRTWPSSSCSSCSSGFRATTSSEGTPAGQNASEPGGWLF